MKLPRDIAGRDLVRALVRDWGYREVNRAGSHIILQTETPEHHRLAVPDHSPLRVGTFSAILRSVAKIKRVSREEIIVSL